jgi:hypothetical protein
MRVAEDEALERAIADACLSEDGGHAIAKDLRGFLVARGVSNEDVAAALASPRRLAVYRSLVRNGLSAVVLRMLPRTRARLNAACGGRFDADFARFVAEVGPRTHYLRDVPGEFVAWVESAWRTDSLVPAYLSDLAAHELASYSVAASETTAAGRPIGEVSLDRPLEFAGSVRLLRHAWAVHQLPADPTSMEVPARRDVWLLAYRDADHAVRWLELSPLAAEILERLVSGETLGASVELACASRGVAPNAVLDDIAILLSDLGDRGVLLGARVR